MQKKVDIIWDEEDLLNLLCKRVRQNSEFTKIIGNGKIQDKDLFYKVFPSQVDPGSRKPETWVWMMGRIRDGNGIKPPRNLIDLVSMAKEAQLRREAREPREFDASKGLVEPDALRRALSQLSDTRVNDTLLAEAKSRAPIVEKFRGGKSEHNEDSIVALLKSERPACRVAIKSLVEIGFLEEVGGNYKIPMLYRNGLGVTQGKAFDENSDAIHDED